MREPSHSGESGSNTNRTMRASKRPIASVVGVGTTFALGSAHRSETMTENPDTPGETPDPTPAGTNCALCGTALSPSEYPSCRAVLIDESGPGGEEETIRMVCEDCWAGLNEELTEPSELG